MASPDDAPNDLRKIFDVEFFNSFGFQLLSQRMVMVCWVTAGQNVVDGGVVVTKGVYENQLDLAELADELLKVCPSSRIDDSLGRDYVEISLDDWELIPAVINRCLALGVRVYLGNKKMTEFESADGQFSLRAMELKIIADHESFVNRTATSYKNDPFYRRNNQDGSLDEYLKYSEAQRLSSFDSMLKPWNWSTPEGKAYCARLRSILKMDPVADPSQNHYLWNGMYQSYQKYRIYCCGGWSGFKPSLETVDRLIEFGASSKKRKVDSSEQTDSPVVESKKSKKSKRTTDKTETPASTSDDNEVKECVICFDSFPNTLVLPCMHQSVCKKCSDRLKHTNDRQTCVRCRRKITEVMEDYYH